MVWVTTNYYFLVSLYIYITNDNNNNNNVIISVGTAIRGRKIFSHRARQTRWFSITYVCAWWFCRAHNYRTSPANPSSPVSNVTRWVTRSNATPPLGGEWVAWHDERVYSRSVLACASVYETLRCSVGGVRLIDWLLMTVLLQLADNPLRTLAQPPPPNHLYGSGGGGDG